ncbi:uncharacterized protein HMPREF1541_07509 [Cyphellophora europaea CBS 101466]|uniref:Uncharacterized protein n=1 Tax=Cyphellophora europaea (strain CBS 101466) TaxID=1220924 RepID=W2RN26_CYPE1|nr:uncharacterized protein HMPREF1541_07509 [Cyphellophora europaea CBS 101466]ETN37886.1 hypothetical protein HMPREF1541_07509 [Cyphellophora europaea CBS 101466]
MNRAEDRDRVRAALHGGDEGMAARRVTFMPYLGDGRSRPQWLHVTHAMAEELRRGNDIVDGQGGTVRSVDGRAEAQGDGGTNDDGISPWVTLTMPPNGAGEPRWQPLTPPAASQAVRLVEHHAMSAATYAGISVQTWRRRISSPTHDSHDSQVESSSHPPPSIIPTIEPRRPTPRIPQRRRHPDLMEQARLHEQLIWTQRAQDGGLTQQQRELYFGAQPLLASVPEERRQEAEREYAARIARAREDEGGARSEFEETSHVPRRRLYLTGSAGALVGGTYGAANSGLRFGLGQIDGVDERPEAIVRFAEAGEDWVPRSLRVLTRGDVDTALDEAQVLPASRYDGGGADRAAPLGEDRSLHDTATVAQESLLDEEDESSSEVTVRPTSPNRGPSTVEDMPLVPVNRSRGENREAWELVSPHRTTSSSLETLREPSPHINGDAAHAGNDGPIAALVNCPCHEEHQWTRVSSVPTHRTIQMHDKETLAQQRDSRLHRATPQVDGDQREDLSEDTLEILVTFESCAHSLAVFVERLDYQDANQITARCGCHGFDRCLVAARRAMSTQECLVCRIHRKRGEWAKMTGHEESERFPWFERYVRCIDGRREWQLWPFGAKSSRPETGSIRH